MAEAKANGRMIVFHGGKPGEGKSLLAQNLAAALTARGRSRVLLLDMDNSGASEHRLRWGLPEGVTLAEITGRLHRFDEQTIRGYFPKARCGVEVAVLAENPVQAMEVTSQQLFKALELFRAAFDFVVVDGLTGWDTLALGVLDAADVVLMVCSPDLVGIKRERQDSLRYQELKFPVQKIGLVINRCTLPEALDAQDLEKSLTGHKVLAAVPYDSHVTEAINNQRELLGIYPNSAFAKAIRELSARVSTSGTGIKTLSSAELLSEAAIHSGGGVKINRVHIKERIHALLLENPELKVLASEPARTPATQALLREKVEGVVTSLMAQEAPELTDREDREALVREVVDEALGLGPLEDLIRNPEVTEIMVNRRDQIYVEQKGKLTLTAKHFVSDKQLLTVMERIVAPLGRRIDESQPYVDARLADGSRVNAIIPPLALNGPTLTIRKFSKQRLLVSDLIKFGSLNQDMADFLGASVLARKNIVISGGTGSGKTTLLNIISSYIPEDERIVTVEDAAELNLPQPHVVTLEARPANIEGKGAITIRDLVRNCLRMRPDRIVVGECRGGEALDMLQAMNTGHDGSLTTAHANTPRDVIARLETMVLMSGMDLPVRAIREQIAGAVNLVVQQTRLQDGTRKVTQIAEVVGLEEGSIVLKDIFMFKQTGLDKSGKVQGEYKAA
ncbi:MAG: Flp pilus assembly complex ATPase component TadA, partial [Candidatus Firestonebacteria bacterium]|nr:Flp pilus assembly complex ATPase component TadA [Candidatus Firestonebacteria bacterium]